MYLKSFIPNSPCSASLASFGVPFWPKQAVVYVAQIEIWVMALKEKGRNPGSKVRKGILKNAGPKTEKVKEGKKPQKKDKKVHPVFCQSRGKEG